MSEIFHEDVEVGTIFEHAHAFGMLSFRCFVDFPEQNRLMLYAFQFFQGANENHEIRFLYDSGVFDI